MGDHEKTVAVFRKATQLNPERPDYYNNLGFALYEAGRKKESFSAFQKSLSINKDQPAIKNFMAAHGLGRKAGD